MKRVSSAVLLAVAAAFAGCKGSGHWADKLNANPLYQRAKALRQSPACLRSIPIEFGDAYPVPVKEGGRSYFEVLFYPTTVSPSKCTLATPVFAGRFSPAAPDADRCLRLDPREMESLGPCRPGGLSLAATYKAELRLYESLDRAAALYLGGEQPSARDRVTLTTFVDSFRALAEPGLLPFYYRQSPAFWDWLRDHTGQSINGARR